MVYTPPKKYTPPPLDVFDIFPKVNKHCRYTSEINMPDVLALYRQLGVTPPSNTWEMPTKDCEQLFDWETGYINPAFIPFQRGRDGL